MITGQLGFVTAAYSITALVIIGVVVWLIIDRAKLKKTLKQLDEEGISRQDTGYE